MITQMGWNVICGTLSMTMLPQLAVGGCTPSPRAYHAAVKQGYGDRKLDLRGRLSISMGIPSTV